MISSLPYSLCCPSPLSSQDLQMSQGSILSPECTLALSPCCSRRVFSAQKRPGWNWVWKGKSDPGKWTPGLGQSQVGGRDDLGFDPEPKEPSCPGGLDAKTGEEGLKS